jgi:hypothetical protein
VGKVPASLRQRFGRKDLSDAQSKHERTFWRTDHRGSDVITQKYRGKKTPILYATKASHCLLQSLEKAGLTEWVSLDGFRTIIAKIVYFSSSGILLTDHSSGFFFKKITRAAIDTIVLGITVMLAAGCASTSDGVSTRRINPVANNQQATNFEEDSWYQPSRSPEFDPDLLGGE